MRTDPITIAWTAMAVVGVGLSSYGVYVSHFILERAARRAHSNGPRLAVAKSSCRREALRLLVQLAFVASGIVAMLPPKTWSRTVIVVLLLGAAAIVNVNSITDQLFRLRMFRYFERNPDAAPDVARGASRTSRPSIH